MVDTGLTSRDGSNSMITYDINKRKEGAEEVQELLPGIPDDNKCAERVEEVQQLLPGIPDDITVNLIATKLSWMTFYMLSSVSRRWDATIRSHEIFQARCSSQCTQTLFALQQTFMNSYHVNAGPNSSFTRRWAASIRARRQAFQAHCSSESSLRLAEKDLDRIWTQPNYYSLVLYSPDDGSVYLLPPIPGFDRGGPRNCECVFVDGKLYALGGNRIGPHNSNVHVFDLVGGGQWKPCASMKDDREDFQCGVMNGKIYVFGGKEIGKPFYYDAYDINQLKPVGCETYDVDQIKAVLGCEVYDPAKDFWSPITSDATKRLQQVVIPIGEEFLFYSGWTSGSHHSWNSFVDFYHPAKDQWRRVQNFLPQILTKFPCYAPLAMIGGKIHRLEGDTTEVYDTDTNEWTSVKSVYTLLKSSMSCLDNPALYDYVGTIRFCAVVENTFFAIVETGIHLLDLCIIRCHRSHSNNNETKQEGRHSEEDAQSAHHMIWDRCQTLDFGLDNEELLNNVLKCPVQL